MIMEIINSQILQLNPNKKKIFFLLGLYLRRNFENEHVDRKATISAWKNLNIKKSAYLQVVRMQEGSTMNGYKRAQITGCVEKKYCKICPRRVATTPHILLTCPVNKKKQIAKHDLLAEAVYHKLESKFNFNKEIKIRHFRMKQCAILTWNSEVVSRSYGKFPKKPDVFFRSNWYAIIIDVAIVADHNLNKGYIHKINAYTRLSQHLREKLRITTVKIVPVIASINGLINKQSIQDLQEIGISIDWKKIMKDIVIRNMQDLMFYNGVNMKFDEIAGEIEDQTVEE